ncbi:glycoside hydrolase domain-containing protein [Cohnella hashimotonis]|uniref:DUF4091 domain-containing protein n=1 Tax=Cohnella hashimotonis TaxID=2826895 RepID=A0ABT6TN61_9BACL|nr:glycoside hydrolase domain-containing protein [Cohnella hashimotonis]MDI4648251.1 DUF4091 domain-containing protein [Cohnella hashimotonis]
MSSSYLIHDMVRVCPQTGEVLEEQARAGSLAELAEVSSNPASPRNAYLSFQLIVRLDDAGPSAIRFEVDPLRGEHDEIGAGEFVFFAQWYHRVKGRYYPDALVPLDGGDAGPRTLSAISAANEVEGQAYAAVWVDLFVPAGVRPGDYRGALRATTGSGIDTHEIRLRVLQTAVPDESLVIADLNSYADNLSRRIGSLRRNPDRYEDGTYFRTEQAFFRMAHEHRCLLHYLPYEHSGRIPAAFIPEIEGRGKEMRVKDWSTFDEHFGPYLDGSAFEGTKRGAIPIPYMYLPFNFHWPADYVKFGTKGYRTEFAGIMEEFHRHFTERGWLRTKFELFLNHKKRYKLFPYDGDETRFVWDEKVNDIYYDLAKGVLEKESGAKFVFRTDASWSYGLHFEKYANLIKLWVVNHQMFSWFPESLDVLRDAGCEIWTYGGAERISRPLLATAISPLAAVARGVDGFVYWENTKWGDGWQETPDAEGSETMFYPGDELFGLEGPIPSIRLKALRNAMQVADCMEQWIGEQPAGLGRERMAEAIVDSFGLAPGAWWPGKPNFLDRPPYEWENAMFSEAPQASLHEGRPSETFNDLKQSLWAILG